MWFFVFGKKRKNKKEVEDPPETVYVPKQEKKMNDYDYAYTQNLKYHYQC